MKLLRGIGHRVLHSSAAVRVGIAACVIFIVVMGSIAFGVYSAIQFHSIQQKQLQSGAKTRSELKSLQKLVNDEQASSLYLRTGVNGLRTILIYIGGSLTAICRAESLCVLPKS
jgi:hypothetical protein